MQISPLSVMGVFKGGSLATKPLSLKRELTIKSEICHSTTDPEPETTRDILRKLKPLPLRNHQNKKLVSERRTDRWSPASQAPQTISMLTLDPNSCNNTETKKKTSK